MNRPRTNSAMSADPAAADAIVERSPDGRYSRVSLPPDVCRAAPRGGPASPPRRP